MSFDPKDTVTQSDLEETYQKVVRSLNGQPRPVKTISGIGGVSADGTPYVFDPRTRSLRKLGPDGNVLKRVRMSKKERRTLKKAIQNHQA